MINGISYLTGEVLVQGLAKIRQNIITSPLTFALSAIAVSGVLAGIVYSQSGAKEKLVYDAQSGLVHLEAPQSNPSSMSRSEASQNSPNLTEHHMPVEAENVGDVDLDELREALNRLTGFSTLHARGQSFWNGLDPKQYMGQLSLHRNPEAIEVYANRVIASNDEFAIASLREHILSVVDGSYQANRYSPVNNLHLTVIAQSFPGILQKWQQNSSTSLADLLNLTDSKQLLKEDIKQWLLKVFFEDYVLGDLGNVYPELHRILFFEDPTQPLEELKAKVKAIKELSPDERRKLTFQHKLSQLIDPASKVDPLALLKELSSGGLFIEKNTNQQQMLDEEQELHPFQEKIFEKIEEIKEKNCILHYEIVFTDNFQDFLFMGSEAGMNTCQSYDSAWRYNLGLLGTWHHGQTRLIAVKDEKGYIRARSLVRLLLNEENHPVVYQEKIYDGRKNVYCAAAMTQRLRQIANELGCDFVSYEELNEEGKGTLTCLGGSAPYEYVDSANGLKSGGAFEFRYTKIIPETDES